ncbi:transposase [Paraburkholderia nemoris]|uniref:transposase n=1 Tax=Paraburkholderia nemoris TaxID=2793076 RepID=UPI0038BA333A
MRHRCQTEYLANPRDAESVLQKTLSDRALEIEHLKLWIAKLQRMQFGHKSEKIGSAIGQLHLRLENLQADDGAATVGAPKRRRPETGKPTGPKSLLEHLPRVDIAPQPDDACCPQYRAHSVIWARMLPEMMSHW